MSDAVPTSSERLQGGGDSFLIEHPVALDALYSNPEFSDVIFLIEGERFRAHKLVLAARCEYFRAMLYGGLKKGSKAEIQLKGTSALAFRTLLKYIYTGKVELSAFTFEQLLAIPHLAHEYGLVSIQHPIVDYLKEKLDIKNVFAILRTSPVVFSDLTESCLQLADQHASYVLASEGFLTLPQNAIMELLSRNSFHGAEIDVFKAICRWLRAQPWMKGTSPSVLFERFVTKKCLRLELIHPRELLSTVRNSELFAANSAALEKLVLNALGRLYQAIVSAMCGSLALNENVATVEPEGIIGEPYTGLPYTITELEEIADCSINTTSKEGEYYEDDDYDDDDDLLLKEDTYWCKVENMNTLCTGIKSRYIRVLCTHNNKRLFLTGQLRGTRLTRRVLKFAPSLQENLHQNSCYPAEESDSSHERMEYAMFKFRVL